MKTKIDTIGLLCASLLGVTIGCVTNSPQPVRHLGSFDLVPHQSGREDAYQITLVGIENERWLDPHGFPLASIVIEATVGVDDSSPEPWNLELEGIRLVPRLDHGGAEPAGNDGLSVRTATGMVDLDGDSEMVGSVVVPPGTERRLSLDFGPIDPFVEVGATGNGHYLPLSLSIEADTPSGSIVTVPIADAGAGTPVWTREGLVWHGAVDFGVGLTADGTDRRFQQSADVTAGALVESDSWYAKAALVVRTGIGVDWDEDESTTEGLGYVFSFVGSSLSGGYQTSGPDSYPIRLGLGWLIGKTGVLDDGLSATPHALFGEAEFGFSPSQPYPYQHGDYSSPHRLFLRGGYQFESLNSVEDVSGWTVSVGYAYRSL